MKKILFLAVVFSFLATLNSYSRFITVTKMNGGANGYDKVLETHDDKEKVSILNCFDPGYSECKWSVDPISLPDVACHDVEWQDLYDYAENQISNGNLSGSYQSNKTYCGEEYYRNVTWTATDIYNSDIEIEFYPVNSN